MELQVIQEKIYEIRGVRVMLDFDLAEMYQVETKALKQSVRRNIERFEGDDFMFELTAEEYNSLKHSLRSQFVTSNKGGIRYMPFAFTEMGVAMLSSVLRSEIAIRINRDIMRAFVAVRNYILAQASDSVELAQLRERVLKLEQTTTDVLEGVNDLSEDMRQEIETIYEAIGALSVKLPKAFGESRKIGFKRNE
ncbi:MAG: ORF6N domain-containing protein [Alistipes onderdonkii]